MRRSSSTAWRLKRPRPPRQVGRTTASAAADPRYITGMNLPMAVPHPVVLRGTRVTLEPFELEHTADLLAVARSAPEEFALTSTPITDEDAEEYFATALNHRASGFAYPFTVRLTDSGEFIGMSGLNDLSFLLRISILGYIRFTTLLDISSRTIEIHYKHQ